MPVHAGSMLESMLLALCDATGATHSDGIRKPQNLHRRLACCAACCAGATAVPTRPCQLLQLLEPSRWPPTLRDCSCHATAEDRSSGRPLWPLPLRLMQRQARSAVAVLQMPLPAQRDGWTCGGGAGRLVTCGEGPKRLWRQALHCGQQHALRHALDGMRLRLRPILRCAD